MHGLLLVIVTAANVGDRTGSRLMAGGLIGRFARLVTLFADANDRGQPLTEWLDTRGGWALEIVRVEPQHWIVEQTLVR